MGRNRVAVVEHVFLRKCIVWVGTSKCDVNSITTRIQSMSCCNGEKRQSSQLWISRQNGHIHMVLSDTFHLRNSDFAKYICNCSVLRCDIQYCCLHCGEHYSADNCVNFDPGFNNKTLENKADQFCPYSNAAALYFRSFARKLYYYTTNTPWSVNKKIRLIRPDAPDSKQPSRLRIVI